MMRDALAAVTLGAAVASGYIPGAGARSDVEVQLEGYIEIEARIFSDDVDEDNRPQVNLSASADPIFMVLANRGQHTFTINPYVRWDQHDGRRTHFDMRQFSYIGAFGDWEVRAGFDRVFWGVTESVHLVDIINQTDAVEDIDGEDKLGQPLVSVSRWTSIGTFTLFAMPYFRERTFAGRDGRPRGPLYVDTDRPLFGSGTNNWHLDWAARYNHSFSVFDLGLSYFSGLSREPSFVPEAITPALAAANDDLVVGEVVLRPRYDIIRQIGMDLQATVGAWLLKFEGISVDGPEIERYWAAAVGVEYTFYQAFGTGGDIGVLAEYLYDSRGREGPSPSEDDLFVGFRWEGNDVATTRVLMGVVFDLDTSAKLFFVEASRRFGNNWRLTVDGRWLIDVPLADPLFFLRRDDFIQVRLQYYF